MLRAPPAGALSAASARSPSSAKRRPVAYELDNELLAPHFDAAGLGTISGSGNSALDRSGLLLDALFEGSELATELLSAAVEGSVLALGESERFVSAGERGPKSLNLVNDFEGAPAALEVGGRERDLLALKGFDLGSNLAVAGWCSCRGVRGRG